jgi:hypothetical protein
VQPEVHPALGATDQATTPTRPFQPQAGSRAVRLAVGRVYHEPLSSAALTKIITRVPMSAMDGMDGMVALGETPAVVEPEMDVDLLPYLTSTGGYVLEKVEGLAIATDGTMWVSTDNDGVDDLSGETTFFSIRVD